jgi:hypothetical protein
MKLSSQSWGIPDKSRAMTPTPASSSVVPDEGRDGDASMQADIHATVKTVMLRNKERLGSSRSICAPDTATTVKYEKEARWTAYFVCIGPDSIGTAANFRVQ